MKTQKISFVLMIALLLIGQSCKKKKAEKLFNQIQQELDEGRDFNEMISEYGEEQLYGKTYEGGIIYSIDEEDLEGYVVSNTDLSASAPWGCKGLYMVESWYTYVGGGRTNASIHLMDCPDDGTAVRVCSASESNGYDDWFLPSTGSMSLIYKRVDSLEIGNFDDMTYWTSTGVEDDHDRAYVYDFDTGGRLPKSRDENYAVRGVRKFEF